VETATAIGERVAITDPAQAAERDAEYLTYDTPPIYSAEPVPGLAGGLVAEADDGPFSPGELSDQPTVWQSSEERLFDDVAGSGFVLVGPSGLAQALGSDRTSYLSSIRCQIVELTASSSTDFGCGLRLATDRPWARRLLEGVTLIRPDRYVYGSVRDLPGAPALVDSLRDDLASGTIRAAVAVARETFDRLTK
jgi:hypothetical protein